MFALCFVLIYIYNFLEVSVENEVTAPRNININRHAQRQINICYEKLFENLM